MAKTPFQARFGIQPRVVQYTDAATITPSADDADIAIALSLSQTTAIANPIATNPFDGQILKLRITSAATQSITFGTAYSTESSLSLPQATTGGGAEDTIAFQYSTNTSKWMLIATTIGAAIANTWRQFTQNVGTKPRSSGSFVVTTTGLTTTRAILVMQATGTSGNADDIEWDGIVANGIATSSTQFTCYWSAPNPVSGSKNFNFLQV